MKSQITLSEPELITLQELALNHPHWASVREERVPEEATMEYEQNTLLDGYGDQFAINFF